jgi:hypothetical protein
VPESCNSAIELDSGTVPVVVGALAITTVFAVFVVPKLVSEEEWARGFIGVLEVGRF